MLRFSGISTSVTLRRVSLARSSPRRRWASTFTDLGVDAHLTSRLAAVGITSPSDTQALALLHVYARRDLILQAETGSGKTLAYLLPMLQEARSRFAEPLAALSAGATTQELWKTWDDGLKEVRLPPDEFGPGAISERPQTRPFGVSGLILVPTQELVRQVARVIEDLTPELSPLVRQVYGDRGLPRRDLAAIVVATPVALADNVNRAQLLTLRMLALDEADMLLSGSYLQPTRDYALRMFKGWSPLWGQRPQIVFAAATLPNRGNKSVGAFLERYFPSPDTLRLSTAGVHKPVPSLAGNAFVQLDAALPLTLEERMARAHLQERVRERMRSVAAEMKAKEGGADDTGIAADVAGEGDRTAAAGKVQTGKASSRRSKKTSLAGLAAMDGDAEDDSNQSEDNDETADGDNQQDITDDTDDSDDDDADDDAAFAAEADDPLAATMAARSAEDRVAELNADCELYLRRVDALRRHALLDALLHPPGFRHSGSSNDASATSAASATADGAATAAEASPSRSAASAKRRRGGGSMLLVASPSAAEPESAAKPKAWLAAPHLTAQGQAGANSGSSAPAAASALPSSSSSSSGIRPLLIAAPAAGAPAGTAAPSSSPSAAPPSSTAAATLRSAIGEEELDAAFGAAGLPPTLVFFNSSEAADAGRKFLAASLPSSRVRVAALHNKLDDKRRAAVVADFLSSASSASSSSSSRSAAARHPSAASVPPLRILCCTDIASRGLDTRSVRHVIQAEFAQDAVRYLHRIGRTARAGDGGGVTNLLTRSSVDLAQALLSAAAAGRTVDEAFSRGRSFRKRIKKAAVTAAEEAVVMAALEREQAALAAAEAAAAAQKAAAAAKQKAVESAAAAVGKGKAAAAGKKPTAGGKESKPMARAAAASSSGKAAAAAATTPSPARGSGAKRANASTDDGKSAAAVAAGDLGEEASPAAVTGPSTSAALSKRGRPSKAAAAAVGSAAASDTAGATPARRGRPLKASAPAAASK